MSELNFDGIISARRVRNMIVHVSTNNLDLGDVTMYSNLPPGVTGREYEIAGPDAEFEMDISCDHIYKKAVVPMVTLNALHQLTTRLFNEVSQLVDNGNINELKHKQIKIIEMFAGDLVGYGETTAVEEPCGFVGSVDAESFQGKIYYDCPACGTSYEQEVEPYIDEDYQRERRYW